LSALVVSVPPTDTLIYCFYELVQTCGATWIDQIGAAFHFGDEFVVEELLISGESRAGTMTTKIN